MVDLVWWRFRCPRARPALHGCSRRSDAGVICRKRSGTRLWTCDSHVLSPTTWVDHRDCGLAGDMLHSTDRVRRHKIQDGSMDATAFFFFASASSSTLYRLCCMCVCNGGCCWCVGARVTVARENTGLLAEGVLRCGRRGQGRSVDDPHALGLRCHSWVRRTRL